MKSFVAVLALVAVAAADVAHIVGVEREAQIVQQDADVLPDRYNFKFETNNGIRGEESGVLKNAGREDEAFEVQGSNSYTAPNGEVVSIQFVANENGYQPQGSHIPTPFPIPEYIEKALRYIAEHPPKVVPGNF